MEAPTATGQPVSAQDTISRLEAGMQKLEEENALLRKCKSRPLTRPEDRHCNIMLDLECGGAQSFNPVIVEIGAIHFGIENGMELSSFHSIVNWESCEEHGLAQDSGSINFLRTCIPETFRKSKEGGEGLPVALRKFSSWVTKRRRATQDLNREIAARENLKGAELQRALKYPDAMVWGNGASADNPWIRSAFKVCDLPLPWQYYNDRCYRTMVEEWNPDMARLFREPQMFQGRVKHSAIDDCKHQVAVLVRSRNELHGRTEEILKADIEKQSKIKESVVVGVADVSSSAVSQKRKASFTDSDVQAKSAKLSSPKISRFGRTSEERLQTKAQPTPMLKTSDPSIPTIEESILEKIEREYNEKVQTLNQKQEDSQPASNDHELIVPEDSSIFSNTGKAVKTSMGLITPSSSFSGPPSTQQKD